MHFVLIVSILATLHANHELPTVSMQEFNTYPACVAAARMVKSQYRAQHGESRYYSDDQQVNAVCMPKGA